MRTICLLLLTYVQLGTDYVDLWLMHWPGPGRHLNYPPVRAGMDRPKGL